MPIQLFLSGHGGWKPVNGYTQVPKGCSITFYTNFAKNLITGMEYQILAGTYHESDRTIREYMSCPNMQLSAQDDDWTQKSRSELAKRHDANCVLFESPPDGLALADLFEAWVGQNLPAVDFHWMACQTLQLKKVGGRAFGLNAGDFAHDPSRPGRYRITLVDGTYRWIR